MGTLTFYSNILPQNVFSLVKEKKLEEFLRRFLRVSVPEHSKGHLRCFLLCICRVLLKGFINMFGLGQYVSKHAEITLKY